MYYISSRSATIIQTYNRHILCFLLEAPQAFRFIGDKETRARPTSQCFDNSDFIGYLKVRSEMTPYGKLLVVMRNGFTYLIQIRLGNWGKLLTLDKTEILNKYFSSTSNINANKKLPASYSLCSERIEFLLRNRKLLTFYQFFFKYR